MLVSAHFGTDSAWNPELYVPFLKNVFLVVTLIVILQDLMLIRFRGNWAVLLISKGSR